jgi:hypothetical protein
LQGRLKSKRRKIARLFFWRHSFLPLDCFETRPSITEAVPKQVRSRYEEGQKKF